MRVSRRRWLISTSVIILLLLAAAISLASRVPLTSRVMRERVVATLADRLDADVDLDALALRIYPRLHASGTGLRVYFQHRRDVPPLIAIGGFSIKADLVGLWRHRVAEVSLEGLEINIPPADVRRAASTGLQDADTREVTGRPAPTSVSVASARDFVIERMEAPDAQLTVLRSDPEKAPRVWYMHRLVVRGVGASRSMPFETFLTNAVPPGQIAASGYFGPWQRDEPGATPLGGTFTFENADLSVFKGISGILSATGRFDGALERIAVDGRTTTPDFMVNISGHPTLLETTYHAVVDGTNGNTTLDSVDARFRDTRLIASGGVYERDNDVKGREVRLDVALDEGRLEDVLRLAVPTPQPTMTGTVALRARLRIPPGPTDIVEKLALDGRFTITGGRFTDRTVQQRLDSLSTRARGDDASGPARRIRSNFAGRFSLDRGRLSMPTLTFDIPGAVVSLAGVYGLRREQLQFAGTLYMDAKLSEMTTGWKSWLLKAADPLFRRQGRTRVPLKISGTRDAPRFGLDVKRVFRR